jgi:hypothetical protein
VGPFWRSGKFGNSRWAEGVSETLKVRLGSVDPLVRRSLTFGVTLARPALSTTECRAICRSTREFFAVNRLCVSDWISATQITSPLSTKRENGGRKNATGLCRCSLVPCKIPT